MKLLVTPHTLSGEIQVPGSKSHTIRAVALAMMADGVSVIRAPLLSADTCSVRHAAELAGAEIRQSADGWTIRGTGGVWKDPGCVLNMENSGTGTRLLASLAALQHFPVRFDGDDSLRTRPMKPLLDALEQLGVQTKSCSGKCPFSVSGPLKPGRCLVNGKSSQYVSAMLLASPLIRETGTVLLDVEDVNEQPYIGITLSWLQRVGIRLTATEDCTHFEIPCGQKIQPFDATIPADFSTAAFPLAAAAVTGGPVRIRNLDFEDPQGDKALFDHLEKMGLSVERSPGVTAVFRKKMLRGMELDLNATPDALPAAAVVAAFAEGATKICNVAQARLKETDRIACMTRELRKMGADVTELPDGMVIRGGKRLHGNVLNSYRDHRIAMALAVAGLGAEGTTVISDAECAGVTYPDFIRDFNQLGAGFVTEE